MPNKNKKITLTTTKCHVRQTGKFNGIAWWVCAVSYTICPIHTHTSQVIHARMIVCSSISNELNAKKKEIEILNFKLRNNLKFIYYRTAAHYTFNPTTLFNNTRCWIPLRRG